MLVYYSGGVLDGPVCVTPQLTHHHYVKTYKFFFDLITKKVQRVHANAYVSDQYAPVDLWGAMSETDAR